MKQAEIKKIKKQKRERGATMVEYGLLVVLIAIVGMSGLQVLGYNVRLMFMDIKDEVGQAGQENPGIP